MSIDDFIEEVELSPPPPSAAPTDAVRREPGDKDTAEMKAAIDSNSLLSFVDGITGQAKDDVLLSVQFAARAASAKHDRFDETEQWYAVYIDTLERVGWAGERFAFSKMQKSDAGVRMDKKALSAIAAIATGSQLSVLEKTIEALESMADDDGTINLFEAEATSQLGGNFQIGAVEMDADETLSMALGAFHFQASERKRNFLFVKWRDRDVELWTAAQKMVLDQNTYAAARDKIRNRLTDAMDFIDDIPIT